MVILENDGNLERATEVEGYKVLPPCVLYGKIGQGGMGAVYRGRHLNLDIDVAVKCLKPGLVGSDDQFVVRFRREARSAAQINHQNVIRVYDVAEDQGLHYLIMELVQGETARERVVRKQKLTVGEALEIVYGAAQGLAEAHRKGFIHRDIKPDNIMISSSGQVKVADLGLAKPSIRDDHASMLSGTNLVMGTPQYMPPEQWENTTTVTPAADVWALGATLYYLLVGGEAIQKDSLPKIMQRIMLQPFPDPRRMRPDVPEDVAALIAKATATAAEDRYQNAQELAEAMEQLATRRDALKDKNAVPTSKVENLVSPPPAKTLAKIKFWLDRHGQEVAAAATGAAQGPGGTMVVNGTREVITPLPVAPVRRKWWLVAVGVLALAAGVAAVTYPWSKPRPSGIFAESDRFEAVGQFEQAIAEAMRVHAEDPSLMGKPERLGRLTAAWARDLGVRGEWREALVQLERSRMHNDTPGLKQQKAELLERIRSALETKLVRESPATKPVAETGNVEFVGRLADSIVASLRIGGVPAVLQDGAFRVSVDATGKSQMPVDVTLTSGDVVALSAWSIVHAGPTVVRPPATLTVSPEVVSLDDDKESELLVRVAKGATVTIDNTAQRVGDDGTVRFPVRSTDEQPRPLTIVVRQDGCVDTTRTVPVQRTAKTWSFARAVEVIGGKVVGNQIVTKEPTVKLVGRPTERATTVLVNGKPAQVQWADSGAFECQASLPGKGVHLLRVELQKPLRPTLTQEVTVVLVGEPVLELAPPCRDGDITTTASYVLVLTVDAWTKTVTARRGGVLLQRVDVPVGSASARIEVALQPGANDLELEAVNVVDTKKALKVKLTRNVTTSPQDRPVVPVPPVAAPEIDSVFVLEPTGERAVLRGKTTRVRSGVRFRVAASDPAAVVVCNGKELGADDLLLSSASGVVKESRGGRLEIKVRNSIGVGKNAFVFRVEIDDQAPEFVVKAPAGPVGAGKPFVCSGTWSDNCAVVNITVNGEPAKGANPASDKGTFSIELPAIDGPVEYEMVFTDEAGNSKRVTQKFVP